MFLILPPWGIGRTASVLDFSLRVTRPLLKKIVLRLFHAHMLQLAGRQRVLQISDLVSTAGAYQISPSGVPTNAAAPTERASVWPLKKGLGNERTGKAGKGAYNP